MHKHASDNARKSIARTHCPNPSSTESVRFPTIRDVRQSNSLLRRLVSPIEVSFTLFRRPTMQILDTELQLSVERHACLFDFEEPMKSYEDRLASIDFDEHAVYLGPRVTVCCRSPTKEFWRSVYAEFSSWRQATRKMFARRRVCRRDGWVDPHNPSAPKSHQLKMRRIYLTGFLFINLEELTFAKWPSRETVGYRPRRRAGRHRAHRNAGKT
jgi:hypothetical protein